ncbi:MAG: glycosyltransferase [Planctomycetota bacterium]
MTVPVTIWLHDRLAAMRWEFEQHPLSFWIFAAFAIMILLEIPRYYLAPFAAAIAHALRYPRLDREKVEALWRREPLVSVVVAGRNEEATIGACVRSLLDQNYRNYEIIVVDDCSSDATSPIARHFASTERIRLLRNDGLCGRGGRPSASNLGLAAARGEFLVSVDADCSFDRNLIRNAIAPFSDPTVGGVAGNVHVRHPHRSLLTQLQALEYALCIDVRKRWTTLLGCTLQASGALGAFRTDLLREIGGWDPELAEDSDVSLRVRKAGYRVVFAPGAAVLTDVPSRLKALIRQRTRWDRGGLRVFFTKHCRLLRPRVAGWSFSLELWTEFLVTVVATAVYPGYLVWMLLTSPHMLVVMLALATLVNCWLSLLSLAVVARVARRLVQPWRLVTAAVLAPFYKGMLRWVRARAFLQELLRVRYEDPFLPRTVWREAPRR